MGAGGDRTRIWPGPRRGLARVTRGGGGQATAVPDKGAGQSTWCAEWGGFLKDVKRRDTANYMFVTAGPKMLRLWALDPVWPRVFVRPGAAPAAALVLLLV